jgi:isopropylmalate/homocitrate/citramalate synthase
MSNHVTIVEVGPRDGLQNEAQPIPLSAKVAFIDALSKTGLTAIETTSFVSPKAVPQMADAVDVMADIERVPGIRYLALTPNEKGFERALESSVKNIALFTSATEAFCQANIRCSIDESFVRFEPVVSRAKAANIWVRGYVSVAFVCPFSGDVDPQATVDVGARLLAMGCDEICFADTVGRATPAQIHAVLIRSRSHIPIEITSLHVHDTGGRALENIDVALERGVRIIDGSAGGLGGCPFAPGAPGNAATESIVRHLHKRGFETGVDADLVEAAVRIVRPFLTAREAPSPA